MIKLENIKVFNFEGALRGLRNPMNSWAKSDSKFENLSEENTKFAKDCDEVTDKWVTQWELDEEETYHWLIRNGYTRKLDAYTFIGPQDMMLAQKMVLAGPDEGKFLRQIFVSMDITAPRYWWSEMDTYKVATVANSTSTMHKLTSEPITEEMFSFENGDLIVEDFYTPQGQLGWTASMRDYIDEIVRMCEQLRQQYLETKDKRLWRALIQMLPSGFNQKRTWTANYQVLRNIFFQRRYHKLKEWKDFCEALNDFPYGRDLITIEREK